VLFGGKPATAASTRMTMPYQPRGASALSHSSDSVQGGATEGAPGRTDAVVQTETNVHRTPVLSNGSRLGRGITVSSA
jgi:hypothetical protein